MARGMHAGRKIIQLNYETGEPIGSFDNLALVAKALKVSEVGIKRALNDADGFMHMKKLRFKLGQECANSLAINELDYHTGEFLQYFPSVEHAVEFFDITRDGIYKALTKKNGLMPYKQLRFAIAQP